MAKVIQEISVEVAKPNYFPPIIAKQCDCDSRFLKVKLMDGGKQIFVTSNSTPYINVLRQDGKRYTYEGEKPNDDGTVTVPLTSEALEECGDAYCDITIIRGDEKLTSAAFHVDVRKTMNVLQGG